MPFFKSTLSEKDLLAGCIRNERRKQELLYKQYCQSMLALCITYAKSEQDALEILQDGFLKIFQKIHTYDASKSSLYTWMRTVMVRTAIDFLRKQKKEIQTIEIAEENEPIADERNFDKISSGELMNYLQQLPEVTRTVFNLFVSEGYSHKEIGAFLNISEGTSRWHLSEARKFCSDHLKNKLIA